MTDRPSSAGEQVEVKLNGVRVLFRVRTLGYLLAALGIGGGATAMARMVGVASTADVAAVTARVAGDRAEYVPRFERLETAVEKQATTIGALVVTTGELRDSQYDDRAERLADKVADPIRDARRSRETWQRVKAKALANQRAGNPIRDGLEAELR